MIGNGAVIDHQFQTVDVFVLMPLTAVEDRYMARYGQTG
jgi:putative hemolysin